MRIEDPDKKITGTFTTTTKLAERAHQFASQLGIRVEEHGFSPTTRASSATSPATADASTTCRSTSSTTRRSLNPKGRALGQDRHRG
jgi:hypothetical protein